MKNLILFGAGASFGSDNLSTPPLGADLFHDLAKFNPSGWGAIQGEFRELFEDDFEKGMKSFASKNPFKLPGLQREMAAYFFNYQPRDTNLYYRLACDLKRIPKEIVFSSLNYETLLRNSFRKVGYDLVFNKLNENQIELNLPHGCCNLFCDSVKAMQGFVKMDGLSVKINGGERFIDSESEFINRITRDEVPPVMSYFEPSKVTMAGEQFLMGQRARYKQLVDEAEQIIVIGVKIREHDSHIWDPIKNAKGKFIYCSGPNEADQFNSWVRTFRTGGDNVLLPGFWAEEYDQIFDQLF